MKLKTILTAGIIAFVLIGLTSCAATTKYGCPPSKIDRKKFTA